MNSVLYEIFYIGHKFYTKSGTMMSSIYEIGKKGEYIRSDWGLIQTILERGDSVHIRPATKEEMLWAYENLEKVEEKLREFRKGEK